MSSSLDRLVLTINASYEAVNVVTAKRAMTLLCKGAAVEQESSDQVVRTSRRTIPVPSVIRLLHYKRIPRQNRAVSRKGVILRDQGTCQYCGVEESTLLERARLQKRSPERLTLDHVIPRSRGGESTWENLVACCFACNNKKGDRDPEQAGMPLSRRPRQLTINAKHRSLQGDRTAWERYLF